MSLRRLKNCPKQFVILSFGLSRQLSSPRIAIRVEAYPHRWSHHMIIRHIQDIDDEVMQWLDEAHNFALHK